MNKQFIIKMLQAKQLEYEALKEILPETMVNGIEKLENELIDIAKEYFMDRMNHTQNQSQDGTQDDSQDHTHDHTQDHTQDNAQDNVQNYTKSSTKTTKSTNSKVRKVTIE